MHSARSALDVLACQLVKLNGKRPDKRTAFPVYDEEPDSQQRRNIERNLRGMSETHAERIRELQPYRHRDDPKLQRLAHLAILNNLDKHQLIHPVLRAYEAPDSQASFEFFLAPLDIPPDEEVGFEVRPAPPGTRFRDGIEICRVWVERGNWGFHIGYISPMIPCFGLDDIRLPDLFEIRDCVVGVIESFRADFSDGS